MNKQQTAPEADREDGILAQQRIDFTRPDLTGQEIQYLRECLDGHNLAGDGLFTARCSALLERHYGSPALLTHSCTAALELAALLTVKAGDEVIMPSYTFTSTANAFVLRGAVPIFVDVCEDTLNIDEKLIETAIGPRTRAIVPVHYAGVGCAMDTIMAIAAKHELIVIEDAAQAHLARWCGKPLGTFGALGALSFHQTKNVVSGEGGALIVNDPSLIKHANILREKGTNRTEYLRGEVEKYEWLDLGSSFLPSDLIAAVLLAQIEAAEHITTKRVALWERYHANLASLETAGFLRRPAIPPEAHHNAHIYYVLFDSAAHRDLVYGILRKEGIAGTTHYVPLHSSPAGRRYGRTVGPMTVTDRVAATMLRLPLHGGLEYTHIDRVVDTMWKALSSLPAQGTGYSS